MWLTEKIAGKAGGRTWITDFLSRKLQAFQRVTGLVFGYLKTQEVPDSVEGFGIWSW